MAAYLRRQTKTVLEAARRYHDAGAIGELPDYTIDPLAAAEYVARVASVDTVAGEELAAAVAHVRYITLDELRGGLHAVCGAINDAATTRPRCLVISQPLQKSNAWIALEVAELLRFDYAVVMACKKDMTRSALQALNDIHAECIIVDDCLYSGRQMTESVALLTNELMAVGGGEARFAGPFKAVVWAAVPFVHVTSQIDTLIHPAARHVVRKLSAELPRSNVYLSPIAFDLTSPEDGDRGRVLYPTLTYLQTRLPDYISFPDWLLSGGNPFNNGTWTVAAGEATLYDRYAERFRDSRVALVPACARSERPCPPRAYAKANAAAWQRRHTCLARDDDDPESSWRDAYRDKYTVDVGRVALTPWAYKRAPTAALPGVSAEFVVGLPASLERGVLYIVQPEDMSGELLRFAQVGYPDVFATLVLDDTGTMTYVNHRTGVAFATLEDFIRAVVADRA